MQINTLKSLNKHVGMKLLSEFLDKIFDILFTIQGISKFNLPDCQMTCMLDLAVLFFRATAYFNYTFLFGCLHLGTQTVRFVADVLLLVFVSIRKTLLDDEPKPHFFCNNWQFAL